MARNHSKPQGKTATAARTTVAVQGARVHNLKNISVEIPRDRLVVITDEQSHDHVPPPHGKGYVINVASNRNGVGYGEWMHIDGWSEAVVEFIAELESTDVRLE